MTRVAILIFSTCLVTTHLLFATELSCQIKDTSEIETRIKQKLLVFKKQDNRQIHRYENPDSIIVFGSNKERVFLTSVFISDNIRNQNLWFYYDSAGLFKVNVVEKKKPSGGKRKRSANSYYFENGLLVYKTEGILKLDPAKLLTESGHYKDLAKPYLKPE